MGKRDYARKHLSNFLYWRRFIRNHDRRASQTECEVRRQDDISGYPTSRAQQETEQTTGPSQPSALPHRRGESDHYLRHPNRKER